jgi:hypothetical protein
MRASVPSTFKHDSLQSVYELRALIIIAFALVVFLVRQLNAMGLEVVAIGLVALIGPPMAVVVVGGVLEAVYVLRERLAK